MQTRPMQPRLRNQPRRPTRGGFTLLEVLIVLAIIGVIAAMVVPRLIGQQRDANVSATKATIKQAQTAIQLYAKDHYGRWPDSNGTEVWKLLGQPEELDGRKIEPYVSKPMRDAWGQELMYDGKNLTKAGDPKIWSIGYDKTDGTEDDVRSWEKEEE